MTTAAWTGDGDWTKSPWFLSGDFHDDWESLGLPRPLREEASVGLARIFTPEVCRAARLEPLSFHAGIMQLFDFVRNPSSIADLLNLGLNALRTAPWDDLELIKRLHNRNGHFDAAFEVRVHAALKRSGSTVTRIKQTPTQRTRDFDARFDGRAYELELKLSNLAKFDVLALELDRRLLLATRPSPGRSLVLRGSEELALLALDDADAIHSKLDEIVSAFQRAAERLLADSTLMSADAGPFGSIEATHDEGDGRTRLELLPELGGEKKASRVVRNIRDGLKQLTGAAPGVLVIGTSQNADPFLVEEIVRAKARTQPAYKKCRMIVLVHDLRVRTNSRALSRVPTFHAFCPFAYRHLSKRELALAATIAGTHSLNATRLDKRLHESVIRPPARPRMETVSLGTVNVVPGTTVKFSLSRLGERLVAKQEIE